MSFSGSESYSELCQPLEMELLTPEYASVSLSLTGEIFAQKSDNWFNQKKRKVYDSLHISEKDKKLQSIWASKCKLIWKHFFFFFFWVVTLKSSKDRDKGSWQFAYAYSLY